MDRIFYACVKLLEWMAAKLGTTYNRINVWVFCVIWPILFAASVALNVWLLMHRH